MNLVDSSAWLAYFADEPIAAKFSEAIEDIDLLIVPTVCLHEVFKVVLRERGEDDALLAVAMMQQGKVVPLDENLALESAALSHELNWPSRIRSSTRRRGGTKRFFGPRMPTLRTSTVFATLPKPSRRGTGREPVRAPGSRGFGFGRLECKEQRGEGGAPGRTGSVMANLGKQPAIKSPVHPGAPPSPRREPPVSTVV